ncbi:tRNA lysidine(34) synthetase TilS [Paenibacillus turpanensis]|uniref:tRNA lysidine(34) synthetase TilS n=1 Tax=Paenibacillus turpanensis TaxID=2689078 RepID=UPI001FB812B4|nr:tRNA lysidine(34) synthetase TilS [Paenibacillus turpanensis]
MKLQDMVLQTIEEERLIGCGDTVVTAVSGGPDSVALLHVLWELSAKLQIKLAAAHVNHGFRGAESDAEEAYVRELAERLGLPCFAYKLNMPEELAAAGGNPQELAREKRYALLFQAAREVGAAKLALGHHAGDQAETVLMRVLRGTGVSGLAGIPVKRSAGGASAGSGEALQLVRPLLRISKNELIAYCEEQGLAPRTDSSNATRKYFRNQIRLDIIPYLKQWNPQLEEALLHLAETARADNAYLDAAAMRWFTENVRQSDGCCTLNRLQFQGADLALQRRIIKLILNYLFSDHPSLDFQLIEKVKQLALQRDKSSVQLDLGGSVRFRREYDQLVFQTVSLQASIAKSFRHAILEPSETETKQEIPETGGYFVTQLLTADVATHLHGLLENEAIFDWDQLLKPLALRSREPGDRMRIYGLNGSKKVKDMLIDAKVPPSRRDRLPILVDAGNNPIWIPGVKRSDAAAVTGQTLRAWKISYFY